MTQNQTLQCGIIGCGVIAPAHIESLIRLADVKITWLCDLIKEKAESLNKKYDLNAQLTANAHEVFTCDDVDLVCICTDHASHAPLVIAALDSGKHVICEKALSADSAGLGAMMSAHIRSPELVFSGIFQHRFDRNARILKQAVDDGAFGTILTASSHARCLRTNEYYQADAWRGTWAHEGGSVLINQAIHFIDLLQWIMGGVQSLTATHANLNHQNIIETEDTAVACLRFRNGALGTFEATSASHLGWENTILIHGTEGSIEYRDEKIIKLVFSSEELTAKYSDAFSEETKAKEIEAGKIYYGSSHPAQIEDVVNAIRENRQPFVPAESARSAVDIVLGIYESHKSGKWVDMPPPAPIPSACSCQCGCNSKG